MHHVTRCKKTNNSISNGPPCFSDTGIIAISITADISKSVDVQRMIDDIVSRWRAVHVACNNAGINMNSASEDTSLEEWDQTFDVNLRGTFMCCQVCVTSCKTHTGLFPIVLVYSFHTEKSIGRICLNLC